MKKLLIVFDHRVPEYLLKQKIKEVLKTPDFKILGDMYEQNVFKSPISYKGYEDIIFTKGEFSSDKPQFYIEVEYRGKSKWIPMIRGEI